MTKPTKRRASRRPQPDDAPLAPDDIDEAYAPRVVDDALEIEVEGERVVIGGRWGGSQVLNPTATLIWQFLDGEATLGELIDDFADELGTSRKIVKRDVLEFARSLGRAGLLVDVEEPVEIIELEAQAAPAQLQPGEELEPFTLPDLDGEERSLTDFRGRRVLLVNWNPGCGYCESIAQPLGELEEDLTTAGVDLVLVASGDAEANRDLVDRAGLRAPVLLKRNGVEPFGLLGTPAATLLDEEGRVASKLAMGAFEVPAEAARLAGVELSEAGAADAADSASGVRYLPAVGGICGPGAASSSKTEWAGTLAVALADTHVGIRYNSDATRALLEKLFVGAEIDDAAVPDNYSVALSAGGGRSGALELLVQGSRQLVRSRSPKRVLAGLLSYLASDLDEPDPTLLRLAATPAVSTDGTALLLPPGLVDSIGKLQPRLAKLGITFVDAPHAMVDSARAELVVAVPAVDHDPTILDEVDAGVRLGRTELPMVTAGRYPLRAWYLPVWDPDGEREPTSNGGLSPALALASTIGQCFTNDLASTAAELVPLVKAVPVRPISYGSATELVERLAQP